MTKKEKFHPDAVEMDEELQKIYKEWLEEEIKKMRYGYYD